MLVSTCAVVQAWPKDKTGSVMTCKDVGVLQWELARNSQR